MTTQPKNSISSAHHAALPAAALAVAALLAGCGQQSSTPQGSASAQPARAVPQATLRAAQLASSRSTESVEAEKAHAKRAHEVNAKRFEKKVAELVSKGAVVQATSRAQALEVLAQKGKTPSASATLGLCNQRKCVLVIKDLPSGTFSFKPAGVEILTEGGKPLAGSSVQVRAY